MSRYLKVIGILSLVFLTSVFLAGRPAPGGGGEITAVQAAAAAQTVAGSIGFLQGRQSSWTETGSSNPYTVSYSTTGLSMTGTLDRVGSVNNYVQTITLSNYSDAATGYTANGTINFSINGGAQSTGTIAADVTLSGGPVTTLTGNVSFTSTGQDGTTTFTGTMTCNGTSFDASTLSLDSINNASAAVHAMGGGIDTVMGNTGSWTENGSDRSYSTTGLSMTGTKTESESGDTLVMTITYTGFASGAVYTVNGTVNVSVTNDYVANTMSGRITANLTLSGGPVTTLTCNEILSGAAGTSSPTAAGTVTCNGRSFDAKTLF